MSQIRFSNSLFKVVTGALYDLPAPSSLSYFWNFGSLLSFCLVSQLLTGLILSMHYLNSVEESFSSVLHIMKDLDSGFFFRSLHMNGASFFFVVIYLHIGRGLYMGSYKFSVLWVSGLVLLLVLMGTAFLGYVLPWGQMSFWGATVITNLVSAVPYLGASIVEWLWGGYSVSGVTLSRFFSFHFLFPFLLCALVVMHLLFLHTNGSSSSSSISVGLDKISFGPYYIYKDLLGLFVFLFGFFLISMMFTYNLGDPENFNPANPLSTPVHIQPEWYFLFAYAILRSIPSKLGGVVALLMSIMVFFFHSLVTGELTSLKLSYFKKFFFWGFVGFFFILTWIGAKPVETPYEGVGQFTGLLYFIYSFMFIIWPLNFKVFVLKANCW